MEVLIKPLMKAIPSEEGNISPHVCTRRFQAIAKEIRVMEDDTMNRRCAGDRAVAGTKAQPQQAAE